MIHLLISGHAHVTDFNVATMLGIDKLATSLSGTKPYIGELGVSQLKADAVNKCIRIIALN